MKAQPKLKKKVNAEVEGKEAAQLPTGQVLDFQGPSHNQGGIDVNLPTGTKIYSKRIKIDGVSMADRKKARERGVSNFEKLLKNNGSDALLLNSAKRMGTNYAIQEQKDLQMQELIESLVGNDKPKGKKKKYWAGDDGNPKVYDRNMKTRLPLDVQNILKSPNYTSPLPTPQDTAAKTPFKNIGMPTVGDAMGIFGNLYQAIEPYKDVIANRASDRPNINAYSEFGKEGLQTFDKSFQYVDQQKAKALQDIQYQTNAGIRAGRNSATGINTMRAMDLATRQDANRKSNEVYDNAGKQYSALLGQKAGLQNQRDQAIMTGDQQRDFNDRADRDKFFTNLSQAKVGLGKGISVMGKNINDILTRKTNMKALNNLSHYVEDDGFGNLRSKKGAPKGSDAEAKAAINRFRFSGKMSPELLAEFDRLPIMEKLQTALGKE